MADDDRPEEETMEREVRSSDPSLSAEANALLTQELREAVGSDTVEVPRDAPDHRDAAHGTHGGFVAALAANRMTVILSFGALVVMGAMASLATGSWWALAIAVAVHAVVTVVTIGLAIQISTQTEHVDPSTAARLEEEGVADPDRVLSDLVEDFAGADGPRGLEDVATEGGDERTAAAHEDPAQANAEQRSAMTPSSEASESTGDG